VIKHGTETAYTWHRCRCQTCRATWSVRTRARVWARMEKRKLVDGRLVAPLSADCHGKGSTYRNWGCRCEPCTAANRARQAERRARP
jgi:hypothetical protein